MISRRFTRYIVALAICAVCIVGISYVQKRMDQVRDEHELVVAGMTPNMTPSMVFAVTALSAFRGLIADILFLKLNKLQEDGKYFELNQLGRYIIQLQPDAPGVYIFLGWNMAYNVSVKFSSPVDRWRWVQRGIELIRDYGLEYNPRDPKIIHELGWIYYHKVGDMLDDANTYYKGQFALQVLEVLGPSGKDGKYDWDRLAAAPNNEDQLKRELGRRLLNELLCQTPEATRDELGSALAALAAHYQKAGKLPVDWADKFKERGVLDDVVAVLKAHSGEGGNKAMLAALEVRLVFIGEKSDFYQLLHKRGLTLKQLEVEFRKVSRKDRPLGGFPKDMLDEVKALKVAQLIDDYFRTRWFRDKFKIDADRLKEVFIKYGYHDVRLPEAHSLYWAEVARQYTPDDKALQRLIRNSIYRSTKAGKLLYVSADGMAITAPKFECIDKAVTVFENTKDPTTGTISGFVNYLKDTVAICYTWGEMKRAKKYYKYMQDSNLANTTEYKNVPLNDFALGLIKGDISDKSRKQTTALLMGMARRLIHCMAFGPPDKAEQIYEKMKLTWKLYHDRLKGKRHFDRLKLYPLPVIIRMVNVALIRQAPSPDIRDRYASVLWQQARRVQTKRDGEFDQKKSQEIFFMWLNRQAGKADPKKNKIQRN